MDTIATRIMQVVELTGGNMSDFARSIDVTPAYISKLKNKPESVPSTDVINKICEKHNVREAWLRRGEGPMKYPEADTDMAIIDDLLSDTDNFVANYIRAIYKTYKELPPEDQEVLRRFIRSLRDNQ